MKTLAYPTTRVALASFASALALVTAGASFAQPAPASHSQSPSSHTMPASAQHGHAARHGHHGEHSHRSAEGHGGGLMVRGLLQGLNLSDTQRDQVFAIMHAQAPALRQHSKEVRSARQDLQRLALSGDLEDSRLRQAAQRASQAMSELAMLRTRTHHEVFKVLTPEQQTQLRARLEQRQQRGGHQHGGHHS